MPRIIVRDIVCARCGIRISATIPQAKRHGWRLWVGGARCKLCARKEPDGEGSHAAPVATPLEIEVECLECHRIFSEGLDYVDGVGPSIHWLVTDENKRRLREDRVPIPLCPGIKRAGRIVETPPEFPS